MVRSNDREFRPRPAPAKSSPKGCERFVSLVRREASKLGQSRTGSRSGQFGRGRVAASLRNGTLSPRSRRVVIKSRFVMIRPGSDAVAAHLRYIERDGVTREGERGQAYGADTDVADTRVFMERSQGDRHQFRFIVSAEDAAELGDLRAYTRTLIRRMEVDLQTRLDWVAVDHHDTDNPHTHLIVRGRTLDGQKRGQDLVIAPDYMCHGMRMRACELATEWLGPRTEREIADSQHREIFQERFTGLDRALLRRAVQDLIDLVGLPGDAAYQRLLAARLQHLAQLGLAQPLGPGGYQLDPKMEETLRRLGERGDILRAMHRAMRGEAREFVIETSTQLRAPIVGHITGKGLADELRDRGYLVIDGVDGRAHYLALPPGTALANYPTHGIVEVRPIPPSAADQNIARLAENGIYRTADHLAKLQRADCQGKDRDSSPEQIVRSHVLRLEGLRRAEIVEHIEEGVWKVPDDLPVRGREHDLKLRYGIDITMRSHLSLAQQIDSPGATWLDRLLIDGDKNITREGFGGEVHQAMQARAEHLEGEGLARRRGAQVVLARGLLHTLRERELAATSKTIEASTGMAYRPVGENGRISGVYRRSIQLASGRYVMLDEGLGFSLVPWRPIVEQRLGQSVSATIQAGRVTWELGRQRGLEI